MARPLKWLFYLLLLAALVAGGSHYYRDANRTVIQYRTEAITRGDLEKKVTATGSLQAVTKTSVGSEVSGTIIKLYADYNSKVKKGDVLALLDPATFRSQVEQQQAALDDAEAAYRNAVDNLVNAKTNVPKADAGVLSAQANVEAARATLAGSRANVVMADANLKKAQAALEYSTTNNTRQAVLLKRDLIAKSDMESARSSYLQDKSNVDSLVAQREASEASYQSNLANLHAREADVRTAVYTRDGAVASVKVAAEQVTSAAAKVSQARGSLVQSQLSLTHTKISSPINGIVIARNVTIGQTVAAQFTAPDLFELAQNLEQMQVEVTVDEADIGQVKPGAAASFTVDAFPEETFTGKVSEVRLAALNTAGVITYTVIVKTRNPQLKLMPGMTATVGITVDTAENALLIPNSALRFKDPEAKPGQSRTPEATDSSTPGEHTPGGDGTPRWRHHHRGEGGEGRGEHGGGGDRGDRGDRGRGAGGEGRGDRGEGNGDRGEGHGDHGGGGENRRRHSARLYTLDANGKLVPHRVRVGITDGTQTVIRSRDLKAGDKIVVEAIAQGGPTPVITVGGGRRGGGPGMRF